MGKSAVFRRKRREDVMFEANRTLLQDRDANQKLVQELREKEVTLEIVLTSVMSYLAAKNADPQATILELLRAANESADTLSAQSLFGGQAVREELRQLAFLAKTQVPSFQDREPET